MNFENGPLKLPKLAPEKKRSKQVGEKSRSREKSQKDESVGSKRVILSPDLQRYRSDVERPMPAGINMRAPGYLPLEEELLAMKELEQANPFEQQRRAEAVRMREDELDAVSPIELVPGYNEYAPLKFKAGQNAPRELHPKQSSSDEMYPVPESELIAFEGGKKEIVGRGRTSYSRRTERGEIIGEGRVRVSGQRTRSPFQPSVLEAEPESAPMLDAIETPKTPSVSRDLPISSKPQSWTDRVRSWWRNRSAA